MVSWSCGSRSLVTKRYLCAADHDRGAFATDQTTTGKMDSDQRIWLLLPRQIRSMPTDLKAVLLYLVITNLVVFLPIVNETALRIVFGLPLVLFIPGYTFIAALFPEASSKDDATETAADASEGTGFESKTTPHSGIGGIERVALSFALSIAVVPLIGLILNFTPWGIRLLPILLALSGFILATTAVATRRRLELPENTRFVVPYQRWIDASRSELFEPETRTDTVLNVLLVVSILLAGASVAYTVAVPNQGETFTEFYLLGEKENGELVTDDYPTNLTVGENTPLVVAIENHEHQTVEYTVVEKLQRVQIRNNSTSVLEEQELSRFSTIVGPSETHHRNHTVTPKMTGERLRLVYLLYRGAPSSDLSVESAYREAHLWVNVSSN